MSSAVASTSYQATVTDEAEELAQENGMEVDPTTNGTTEEVEGSSTIPQEENKIEVDDEADPPKEEAEEEVETVDVNAPPEGASETLYLQNLNEKVRVGVMKQTLLNLFKPYRPLAPITAHENRRMRGQAFVTFDNVENANKARREVAQFPLYGKPIQIHFAKSRSDSAVKRAEGEEGLEVFKKERLEHKRKTRRDNPLRRKAAAKLRAGDDTTADAAAAGPAAAKRARIQMPDEYLPPNNVLFIQNLPEGTTQDDLREVFEVHAGLLEIRTIPAKKDIAFVEFADEAAATVAKDALHNFKIDGETKMKVTYARK